MTPSKPLVAAAVCAFALAVLPPDEASAETVDLGGTADVDLVDIENGTDVEIDQEWTISDLKPSTDTIPYRPVGSLWEATATVELADGGIPVIPGFVARSDSDSYPRVVERGQRTGRRSVRSAAGRFGNRQVVFRRHRHRPDGCGLPGRRG